MPAILRKCHDAAKAGVESVEIWGDGTARREFMYAGDVADFVTKAIARFEELPDVMNLGVGTDQSVNDYYQTAGRVAGFTGKFTHDLSKPAGMKQKLVSIEKQTAFGWKPPTSLEQGLQKTYEFFLQRGK